MPDGSEINALLGSLFGVPVPLHIRKRLLDAIDKGLQVYRIVQDRSPAHPTVETRVRLKPSDWFVELVAAAVANNRD